MGHLSRTPDEGEVKRGPPLGVHVIRRLRGKDASLQTYKYSVLFMTFIAYTCYHASRKPLSVVKSVLDDLDPNVGTVHQSRGLFYSFLPVNYVSSRKSSSNGFFHSQDLYSGQHGAGHESENKTFADSYSGALTGWSPFDMEGGKGLLGDVDLAFLGSYAIGMYFAGHLGDRLDLRYFLTAGMVGSGFFVCLFGMGYWLNIHSIWFFFIVQVLTGILQSTGWPSVVSIVGKWFGKSRRGLIMGIWNAHTSVGNILGSLLAVGALQYGWGWSFVLPGLLQVMGGILMFFFLVVEPSAVGLRIPEDGERTSSEEVKDVTEQVEYLGRSDGETGSLTTQGASGSNLVVGSARKKVASAIGEDEETGLARSPSIGDQVLAPRPYPIGFFEAWNIPGVAPFAFCLFFSKLVAYTFLNWLPFYITQSKIAGKFYDNETAGKLSTLFDVGGVVGGILAGYLSDSSDARAITASGFMYAVIPALFLYRTYGKTSLALNTTLMTIAGMLVNGPYALITTAVSADLGTHSSLKGNPRALATVTAIIDGTGSVGAAIGPLLTGYISEANWDLVFILLMGSAFIAGLLLTRLVIAEVSEKIQNAHPNFSRQNFMQGTCGGSLSEHLLSGSQ